MRPTTRGEELIATRSFASRLEIKFEQQQHKEEVSWLDNIQATAERAWLYVKLTPYFLQLLKGLVMKDWKTTLTAVLGAVAQVVNYFTGFEVPPEVITWTTIMVGLFFAKDGKNA